MPLDHRDETEKPYEFIPFSSEAPSRAAPPGHQALQPARHSGRMRLYFFPRVPVQVASGRQEVASLREGDEVVTQESAIGLYDREGRIRRRPVLPGSSLKGALRTLVEMLSPSCVVVASSRSRPYLPEAHLPCRRADKLCPACRLFGMTGAGRESYQGQVSVEDARLQKGKRVLVRAPLLWAPARTRGGLPGRYLVSGQARGRKLYYHSKPASGPDARLALAIGSQLQGYLHFENLTEGELGLLVASLGLHPTHPFLPKVGAAKPVGYGTVEVHLTNVLLYPPPSRTGRLGGAGEPLSGEALQERIGEWCDAASRDGLLLDEMLGRAAEVLRAKNLERAANDEVY